MIAKTISGHYDTVFSLGHNNRTFVPKNVDVTRTHWNYNCVSAGQAAPLDLENPVNLAVFWEQYRDLSRIYWENRQYAKAQAYEEYRMHLEHMRRYRYASRMLTDNGITAIITLLFLPLLIPCGIYLNHQMEKAREEYDQLKFEQWIRDMEFKAPSSHSVRRSSNKTNTQVLSI